MMRQILLLFICLVYLSPEAGAQQERNELSALVTATQNAYDNNSDSLEYYATKATALAMQLNDIDAKIKTQRLFAVKLFVNGQHDKAIKTLLDVARDAEKHTVSVESAYLYYAIAQVYGLNKYKDISENYLWKGVMIAQKFNNDTALADGYNRMGIMFERREMYDSALSYYQQALIINERAKNYLGKAYSLENIAGIFALKHRFADALNYQKQSLAYKLQTGKKIDLALAYINIAETLDSLRQFDSTILYIGKATTLANEIGYKDLLRYAYQFLSMIHERGGNFDLALQFHKKYTAVNDSIYNETKSKQLAEFNTKYQTEKKEEQIKDLAQKTTIQNLQLKQRNIMLFIVIGLFLAGIIIAYLAYNRRKLKAQAAMQAEINKQQALTAREVFMVEERERKRIAADLHDGVGQMLSATLLNINTFFTNQNISTDTNKQADRILSLVTESYDELRSISHQMMPNALLKAGLAAAIRELISKTDHTRLSINLEIVGLEERISEEVETVLYRVIQECISNVIKHAEATTLNIQLIKDADGISVTIEDNGKGFDVSATERHGIGLKNIYSRLQFHNGTADIDSHPGKGTLVAIHIPV